MQKNDLHRLGSINFRKIKWHFLVFIACLAFMLGIIFSNIICMIFSLILTIYVRIKGYSILFKDYDKKRYKKRIRYKDLYKK